MPMKPTDLMTPEDVKLYREYHANRRRKLPQNEETKRANSAFARAARQAKKHNEQTENRHGS